MTEPIDRMNSDAGAGSLRWMEALLRMTGPRPPVPQETAARVKAAVREHWRAGISRRARARRMGIGIALAAAAALVASVGLVIWRSGSGAPAPALAGQIERVVVPAWAVPAGPEPGEPRRRLAGTGSVTAGTTIVTDRGGRIALRLESGHSLRLDEETSLLVLSGRAVVLHRGAVYVDSGSPYPSVGSIEIRTPVGALRDVGTQFQARWRDDRLHVRVREGTVRFGGAAGAVEVGRGHQLEVDSHGLLNTRAMERAAAAWEWIGEVAPAFPIGGRPLGQFLDWIERERGFGIRWEDARLGREATSIVLQGSIEGLTPEQALESVLATCGLRHRLEEEIIVIGRKSGTDDPL